MEINGVDVLLREFVEADISRMAEYEDDDAFVRFYPPKQSERRRAADLIPMFIMWADAKPRLNYQLAIEERSSGVLLGTGGIRMEGAPEGEATFGLAINPRFWGRGLALQAAGLFLQMAFETLDRNEVVGQSVTENTRVDRLVGGMGFRRSRRLEGDPWMRERGWSFTEWRLSREEWRVYQQKRVPPVLAPPVK